MYGDKSLISGKSYINKDIIKEVLARKLEQVKGEMTHETIGKKTGFSASYIAKILNKKQDISPIQFAKIAKEGFGMTDNEIMEVIFEARSIEFKQTFGVEPGVQDLKQILNEQYSDSEVEEIQKFLSYIKSKR